MELLAYREILKIELADRVTANPAYSLRAMARQLAISPSMLSGLLSGKKKLSVERAFEMAKKLKFDKKKCQYFVTLVQYERAKSGEQKIELLEKLHSIAPEQKATSLNLDLFRSIADWYHFPILELTHTDHFKMSAESIAQALDISKVEATSALQRLLRLELLEEDSQGGLRKSGNRLLVDSPLPNGALRKYHEQMLMKAKDCLQTQTALERFVGSETFAFSASELKKANDIIEDCFTRVVQLAGFKKSKKHVYHMGIQLFRLTKEKA